MHTALDVAGMIPGIGEIADLANAAIYAVEGDWENAAWSAAGAIPFGGNAATAAKWARKAGDFIGNGRRAGRHADDAIGLGRRYADDVAGAGRRGVGDAASAAARKASAVAAARKAAAAAARRAAAILAKKKAAAAAARGAAEKTAKRNPIPSLKAALKPVFKGTDLVSSSPLTPARVVQSFKADVQDSGRVFDFFKKQVVGDGSVVQNVAETVSAVSEVAQSGASPDDLLSALGGLAGRNKGKGKHHDESSGGADPGCGARPNSFDPNTLVLMDDGSRKPIKDVKVGDRVLAKDPTTGRSAVRVVTDVRSHASARTLVEVGVVSGVDRGSVVATDEHPFWVESEKRWSHAVDLKAGHRLETGDHRDATVTGTRSWLETRRVYNLTVDSDHTYYVLAGATSVLVHNCGPTAANGADLEGMTVSEIKRIQNAADSRGVTISVVGSRAKGPLSAANPDGYHAESDWDYVITGINSRTRSRISSSLPTADVSLGRGRRQDIFTGPLVETEAYIMFHPRRDQ